MEKLKGRPIFNPVDFRAYLAKRRRVREEEIYVPEDIIFTYHPAIFYSAVSGTKASPVDWYIYRDRMYRGTVGRRGVGMVHAMVGSSAASMNLEELIAFGARRVYEVGHSGAIGRALRPGDIVVLNGAYSDEGASKHYYKAGTRFASSPALTRRLTESLNGMALVHSKGDAWTVDAPYRETIEKVARFRRKGALVVNMESSAIFAVAKYRGIDAASIQIVSDVLSEEQWEPAFHRDAVERRGSEALESVLRTIEVI